MGTIQQIALSICLVSVAISLLDSLSPEGRFKKQIRLILSLIFLLSILNPVMEGEFSDFNIEDLMSSNEYIEANALYYENLEENFAINIESSLKIQLEQENIFPKKISPIVNISEDNSIDINRIEFILSSEDEENIDVIKEIVVNETACEDVIFSYSP